MINKHIRYGECVLVIILLSAFALQCILSMRLMSASFDETAHLPAGYTYWKTGEIGLNPEHPPLAKLLAAIPLLFLQPQFNPAYIPPHPERGESAFIFGYHFLYSNNADQLLFWGRLPIVLLGLLLGVYVWRWSRRLFGPWAAIVALFAYVTCPNVIGHSRFVTTDLALACFSTMTLYHAWEYFTRGGKRIHMLMTGISLGLALGSKYLAVILPPILILLAFVAWYSKRHTRDNGKRLQKYSLGLAVICAISFILTWAVYFFPIDPIFYIDGMSTVKADKSHSFPFYLMGEFKPGGWLYYFIAAFLLKTQAPILILLLASLIFFRKLRKSWKDELFLLLPVLAFTTIVSLRAANIGVRYLLPIYPLLFIFISRMALCLSQNRLYSFFFIILFFWQTISLSRVWPDYIGYFNEFVGGPAKGPFYLDDSNVDWGQNLILLKRYMTERNLQSVKLETGPLSAPEYYGIPFTPVSESDWTQKPSPGTYIINTNVLIRRVLQSRMTGVPSDWLYRYEPVDRIGTGFYVYEFR